MHFHPGDQITENIVIRYLVYLFNVSMPLTAVFNSFPILPDSLYKLHKLIFL